MTRSSVAAVLAVCVLSLGASAQPYGQNTHPGPMKNFICPAQVAVKFVPSNPAALAVTGWTANQGSFLVQLDPANPPHMSGGNMTCYYKLGGQPGAFMLYQAVGAKKCSPVSDGTGFTCEL
jgi:hypothetical protein